LSGREIGQGGVQSRKIVFEGRQLRYKLVDFRPFVRAEAGEIGLIVLPLKMSCFRK